MAKPLSTALCVTPFFLLPPGQLRLPEVSSNTDNSAHKEKTVLNPLFRLQECCT